MVSPWVVTVPSPKMATVVFGLVLPETYVQCEDVFMRDMLTITEWRLQYLYLGSIRPGRLCLCDLDRRWMPVWLLGLKDMPCRLVWNI